MLKIRVMRPCLARKQGYIEGPSEAFRLRVMLRRHAKERDLKRLVPLLPTCLIVAMLKTAVNQQLKPPFRPSATRSPTVSRQRSVHETNQEAEGYSRRSKHQGPQHKRITVLVLAQKTFSDITIKDQSI
jgi:hypothetical protein